MTGEAAGRDIAAIATALGTPQSDERVDATVRAVRRHDAQGAAQAEAFRGDFRKRDAKAIRGLAESLSELGPNGLAYLAKYGIHLGELANAHTPEKCILAADDLERHAPPPHRGRRPHNNRAFLVTTLAEIFECGGTSATVRVDWCSGRPYGPFFEYVRAAFALSDELRLLGDDAIATFVKRTLKDKSAPD